MDGKSQRRGMAPAYIMVFLSQKCSTKNGIIRPAILFSAWEQSFSAHKIRFSSSCGKRCGLACLARTRKHHSYPYHRLGIRQCCRLQLRSRRFYLRFAPPCSVKRDQLDSTRTRAQHGTREHSMPRKHDPGEHEQATCFVDYIWVAFGFCVQL